MKRVLALVVAAAVALGAAWFVARSAGSADADKSVEVETLLKKGDVAGAHRVLDEARPRLAPHVASYLAALIALSESVAAQETDSRRAAELLAAAQTDAEAAYAAAPDDWRVVSLVFFTRANDRRHGAAWAAVEQYLARHPDDERALQVAAQYWVDVNRAAPDPERALAYLDRIAELPGRTVPPDDPTAVPPETLARLRARAEELRGMGVAAVAAAEERVRAAPGDPDAHVHLAEALRRSGAATRVADRDRAVAAYREAIRLRPGDPALRLQLAKFLLDADALGDEPSPELLPLTEELLRTRPDDPEARIVRARALVRADRIDEAIELYRKVQAQDASLSPDLRREWRRNLAVALWDWKQGGRPGEYLDEAATLLTEYRRLGGEIDSRLGAVWEKLTRRALERGGAPR